MLKICNLSKLTSSASGLITIRGVNVTGVVVTWPRDWAIHWS